MRILVNLCILFSLLGACKSSQTTERLSNKGSAISPSDIHMPITKQDAIGNNYQTKVSYEISSRGLFEYLSISETEILISKDRGLQEIQSYPNTKENWLAVSRLLSAIHLDSLDMLKAPTDKRLYDAAPQAILGVIRGDMEIRSPVFDHGYPPKPIEALVAKVLSIKASVSKP